VSPNFENILFVNPNPNPSIAIARTSITTALIDNDKLAFFNDFLIMSTSLLLITIQFPVLFIYKTFVFQRTKFIYEDGRDKYIEKEA